MTRHTKTEVYFPYHIQISVPYWRSLELGSLSRQIKDRGIPKILFFRQMAFKMNKTRPPGADIVHAGELNLYATLQNAFRYLVEIVSEGQVSTQALKKGGFDPAREEMKSTTQCFVEIFPPDAVLHGATDTSGWLEGAKGLPRRTNQLLEEMLLLRLAAGNPAIEKFREVVDDSTLATSSHYGNIVSALVSTLKKGPLLAELGCTLIEALLAVIDAAPNSLAGQVGHIREQWRGILPPEILQEMDVAMDILYEEQRERGMGGDPGPPPILDFSRGANSEGIRSGQLGGGSVFAGYDYPEYEQFSQDADWMSNVVLMAKMVYIWLDQLSRIHGYPITRLDQVPDSELDRLAGWGFTGLWLIGLWERSAASQRIKQICGNPDAIASAYSLYDYEVAADLGGWEALGNLRERALKRGIRLASDMVPNHTGIYSRWVVQHPDWFVQTDYPPFPTYQFNGEDLSHDENVCIQIEDGYWNKSDAAVVFRHYDRNNGRSRYIYHGNDGTSIPWNDTAQLNYLIPEVRESVIQTILHVARNFPIIRFDAAMTLAKKHYQRLWFPLRGLGGGIPSRAEHGMSKEEFDTVFPVEFWRDVVDRVAVEAPGTLLLAEAFWMMEGYFVRTLGMHRVYNSAFMNMLKTEENSKYRQTIKNVLEFNPEVLKRFVNFMNNPDEKTAVAQFGSQGKYFGACVLLATMPGLPMIGHGQIEGFHEKYGMEYKRAYWDEQVDEGLVQGHEMWIFPLLRRRWLFSGSENFVLYDFYAGDSVDENVFAYSNRSGNQHALVLYNNCHSKTSGWIRESAAFTCSKEGEEPILKRTTLGNALGLDNYDVYTVFCDLTTGLEYIRSAQNINENGVYVELSEYQFHVFMDFKQVCDDKKGSWKALRNHLDGGGVESVEEERKQLEYSGVNCVFRNLLQLVPLSGVSGLQDIKANELVPCIDAFFVSLEKETVISEPVAASGKRITRSASHVKHYNGEELSTAFNHLTHLLLPRQMVLAANFFQDRVAFRFLDQTTSQLIMAWLVLRDLAVDPIRYGLDCTLRKLLAKDHDNNLHTRCVPLLLALQEWWQAGEPGAVQHFDRTNIRSIFTLPNCRMYLQIHQSEGTEWFNKERFEELLEWLTFLNILAGIKNNSTARTLSTKIEVAEQTFCQAIALAKSVGYKSKLFVEMACGMRQPKTITSRKKPV